MHISTVLFLTLCAVILALDSIDNKEHVRNGSGTVPNYVVPEGELEDITIDIISGNKKGSEWLVIGEI